MFNDNHPRPHDHDYSNDCDSDKEHDYGDDRRCVATDVASAMAALTSTTKLMTVAAMVAMIATTTICYLRRDSTKCDLLRVETYYQLRRFASHREDYGQSASASSSAAPAAPKQLQPTSGAAAVRRARKQRARAAGRKAHLFRE